MDDDFETVGSQGFATGYYEDAEMLGQAPPAAMRRFPLPGRAPAPAQQQRFNPAVFQAARGLPGLPSSRGGIAAVTPDQVRVIVRDELSRVAANNPLVPWSGMPQRATPRDEAMWPLGIGLLTFDSTTPVVQQLQVSPQRPFRGERLVLDVRRIGASAQVPAVLIDDIRVGDTPQRVGGGLLSAEIFAPDAFGVRLSLDASVPGIIITLGFRLAGPALAPGDQLVISGGIIGRATESADR